MSSRSVKWFCSCERTQNRDQLFLAHLCLRTVTFAKTLSGSAGKAYRNQISLLRILTSTSNLTKRVRRLQHYRSLRRIAAIREKAYALDCCAQWRVDQIYMIFFKFVAKTHCKLLPQVRLGKLWIFLQISLGIYTFRTCEDYLLQYAHRFEVYLHYRLSFICRVVKIQICNFCVSIGNLTTI